MDDEQILDSATVALQQTEPTAVDIADMPSVPLQEETTIPSTTIMPPKITGEEVAKKHGLLFDDYNAFRAEYPDIATDAEFDEFLTSLDTEEPSPVPLQQNRFAGQGVSDKDYADLHRDLRGTLAPEEIDELIDSSYEDQAVAIMTLDEKDILKPTIKLPLSRSLDGMSPPDGETYDTIPLPMVKHIATKYRLDPRVPEGINAIYKAYNMERFVEDAESTVADLEEIVDIDTPIRSVMGFLGNQAAQDTLVQVKDTNEKKIIELARRNGLNIRMDNGEWLARMPDGSEQVVTPGVMKKLYVSKGEVAGAVVGGMGGVAGAIAANSMVRTLMSLPAGAGLSKTALFIAGAIGSTLGSVAGDQGDYLLARMNQHVEFDANLAKDKAYGTAEMNLIGEALGLGLGTIAYKSANSLSRGMAAIYTNITNGNPDAAAKYMMEIAGIDKTEALKRVAKLEESFNIKLKGSDSDKITQMIGMTENKALAIIASAARQDPAVIPAMQKLARERGQGYLREIEKSVANFSTEAVTDPKAVAAWRKTILENISNYEQNTKLQYSALKNASDDIAPDFQFDIDKVAIEEIREAVSEIVGITQPAKSGARKLAVIDADTGVDPAIVAANAAAQASPLDLTSTFSQVLKDKAAGMANARPLVELIDAAYSINPNRKMSNLIDLRQTVNHLVRQLPEGDYNARKALLAAKTKIDQTISGEMNKRSGGKAWLDTWAATRKEYSVMKEFLDTNKISLTAEKEDVSALARILTKASESNTGVYTDLMAAIRKGSGTSDEGKSLITRLELAMVNDTVQKYAARDGAVLEGIAFPEFAEQLRKMELVTKEAQFLAETADMIGTMFKSDVEMVTNMNMPGVGPSSGIATSLYGKAKQMAVNETFNKLREKMPFGKWKEVYAAKDRLAHLLVDPLNADVSSKLIKDIGDADGKFSILVENLQKSYAKMIAEAPEKDIGEVVQIYRRHGQDYITYKNSRSIASRSYNTREVVPRKAIVSGERAAQLLAKAKQTQGTLKDKDLFGLASRGVITRTDKEILVRNGYLAIEYADSQILKLF